MSCDKLTGKFVFDYANAGFQSTVTVDGQALPVTLTPTPSCEVQVENDPSKWDPTKAWIYPDIYECSTSFAITPVLQGKTYQFNATAFAQPGTVHQDQKAATETFTAGACGALDPKTPWIPIQACCNCGTACVADSVPGPPDAICKDGMCVRCGVVDEPCCEGEAKCLQQTSIGAHAMCQNGVCAACGRPGTPCCSGSDGGVALPRCKTGVECIGDTCTDCGVPTFNALVTLTDNTTLTPAAGSQVLDFTTHATIRILSGLPTENFFKTLGTASNYDSVTADSCRARGLGFNNGFCVDFRAFFTFKGDNSGVWHEADKTAETDDIRIAYQVTLIDRCGAVRGKTNWFYYQMCDDAICAGHL